MKNISRSLFSPPWFCLWLMLGAVPQAALAQYHSYNVANGSDCIMQDYQSVNLPPGIYDAIHEENVTSSDGGVAYFYGGMTHQNNVNGNLSSLVQYSMWPASGVYGNYVLQYPVFAGTNMTWWASTGEGSCCSIKGYWPMFSSNLWNRFVVRYWQPGNGTPHQGYQGMWMKDPTTGNWYHLGTLFYPFAVTGVTGMSGWQENFTGYKGDYIVAHAGGYYHYNGSWQSASQIHFTGGGGTSQCMLIDTNAAAQSSCGPDYTNNVPITLTVTQPSTPIFDPIIVTNYTASLVSTQLLVQWQLPLSSSPQLAYNVQIYTNASYTGNVVAAAFDNDPETHQALLTLPAGVTPYVSLTIADLFFNTNPAIQFLPSTVSPNPATNVAGTVGGLNFQYFQSSSAWTQLANFSSLTPSLIGAVGFVDPTPRQQRINYGFNYTGFITVPKTGLYAFKLNSGDGSQLAIDGITIISFDGLHDSSQFKSGGIALAAGAHSFSLQYFKGPANPVNTTAYTDGIGLMWSGPGFGLTEIPAGAYSRTPAANEPAISLVSPLNGATVLNASPGIIPGITPNGHTVNSVQYWLTDYSYYYFAPNPNVDYYLGQSAASPYAMKSATTWTAPTNAVRARLVYDGTNILDSAPVTFATTNSTTGAWTWRPLDLHDVPSGVNLSGNTLSMVGDNMNLLARQVVGDCTLIGHVAGLTANVPAPDGLGPDTSWRAGIILRSTTNDTTSQPLGDGNPTRFTSLFKSVGGGSYYEDDTMRGGNGDANSWSGNQGNANSWFKIQRTGNTFLSYVSSDGVNWNYCWSNTLANFAPSNYIYAGVFAYALPQPNPNFHRANFDNFSLLGSGVVGPYTVTINPATNAVVGGLPATFSASVIGPVPTGYQWQLNGTNIPGATNFNYNIPAATAVNVGNYTVAANSVTSAPAPLFISAPAGSGVWTNTAGGGWPTSANWSGGLVAGGIDAVADFTQLNLSSNVTVSLNGSNIVGTVLFNDLNLTTQHVWTVATGSVGPLNLAVSTGTPGISCLNPSNIITAVVAGSQGFTKSGPGYLTLNGSSTLTGLITVGNGTLEMVNKSGDTPYNISAGTTLKLGYSTGGGYANTAMTINGSGVTSTNGFYLAGGKTYNCSGQVILQTAPTTLRQYGSGTASIGTFDINGTGLWCQSSASGSATATNVQMVSDGYGMSVQTDPGANNATGDLVLNGPLNVGSLGFYKRGAGSLLLNGQATSGNTAVQIQGGTVFCGATNCLGVNAAVPVSVGASLVLNGFNETVASVTAASNSLVSFGGTNTFTVTNATLAGTIQFTFNKGGAISNSVLNVTGNSLVFGGILSGVSIGSIPFAAGDTFTLFSAPGYSGGFKAVNLPTLPVGLSWSTNNLAVNGSVVVVSNGLTVWNGGGADNNWSTAGNWNGTAPTNGQQLLFAGVARQSNTNDFITAAGQIIFSNGGFNLSGNALSLQWGIVNQAGTNNWAIGSVLIGGQSFVSSNGLLNITALVTNGGYPLSFDGPGSNQVLGVISGPGSLVKTGSGTTTFATQQTYTGGTIISNGVLNLAGGGGSSGPIYGTASVYPGGTLRISTGDGFGYGGGATALTTINLPGGTLNIASSGNQTLGSATINLTGGAITGVSNGNLDFYGGGSGLNCLAATNTATISGIPVSPLRQGSTFFTVAAGSTSSGIDLDISSVLRTSPSGDANGAVLYKAGSGTLQLDATNTFQKPVTVNAGTLLINGGLTSTGAVTVLSGGSLGGSGWVKGSVTISTGGSLSPGYTNIATLTISNTLTLGGTALFHASKNGGVLTNDLALITGALYEGGSLVVTNIGTNAFAAGDRLRLLNAASYSGSFTNLTLPPLYPGLYWYTNGLAASGVVAVSNLTYILAYSVAGTNGSLSGTLNQTVIYGASGTAVTALPGTGYHFTGWSDGSLANPRMDTNVIANLSVTANFAANALVVPVFSGGASVSGGKFQFAFAGTNGQTYKVLTASNLLLPLTNWSIVSTGTFGVGAVTFTNNVSNGAGFFRITSP